MRRVLQVIGVKPEKLAEYRELHRAVPEPVLDRLGRSSITNYSIHLLGDRLIAYFEYTGHDLEADLAAMAADEATRRWWQLTGPCQEPVPEARPGEWWATAEQIFLLE
ncbi:L-rhamnose mutarotase [Amycolatopsis dongchuanensis]|uniref:L-rhamnose mutarotase n=1 Tax=Amycolatopsis dongchuanensis TaxID=1070866 RepID=A0ABP9Q1H0_9PSEU